MSEIRFDVSTQTETLGTSISIQTENVIDFACSTPRKNEKGITTLEVSQISEKQFLEDSDSEYHPESEENSFATSEDSIQCSSISTENSMLYLKEC